MHFLNLSIHISSALVLVGEQIRFQVLFSVSVLLCRGIYTPVSRCYGAVVTDTLIRFELTCIRALAWTDSFGPGLGYFYYYYYFNKIIPRNIGMHLVRWIRCECGPTWLCGLLTVLCPTGCDPHACKEFICYN